MGTPEVRVRGMTTPAPTPSPGTPAWMIVATALVGVATFVMWVVTIYLYVVAWDW